ncbi:unnamed protein product [Effrenium voratum]|nr:unnamed protein product [Effrenium voratum]
MGQRWEAGGARSFKSRPGQGRVLGLHFPRQGRRKGLMLIVCYAPISSARRTDRQEFLRQVTEVKARTPGGDWLIVGGDFNAEIGANQAQHYPTVMGQFGSGSTSRTGPELLEWCQQAREAKRKWHETLDAAIIREEGDRRQLAWEKLVEICLQTSMEILGLRQFRRDDELRDPQRQQDYAQALRDSRVAQATVAQPEAEREAWKEHFRQLQEGREWAVDHVWANVKPEAAAPYRWMGEPPTDEEIEACGQRMKNAKAAGADGFVAEFYKLGSPALRRQVHGLVRAAWAEACSALDGEEGAGWPEVWNRGIVVPLWKKKGDRSNKNTWRGICLLSVGSNLLARVVAQRTQLWSDGWLSEEQAGFRKGRGVDDVLQVTRRITEEAATTKPSDDVILIRLFDIEKAYPRVSKDSLWKVLSIKGAPDNFIKVCKALHEATRYQVRIHGGESQEYEADKGLREGCPSSPPLFNAYHQAVLEDFSEAEEMARAEVLLETTMRDWREKVHPGKTEGLRIASTPRAPFDVRHKGEMETVRHVGGMLQDTASQAADTKAKNAQAYLKIAKTAKAWHFGHQRGRAQTPHSIRVKIMKAVIMPTLTCFGRSRAWNQNQVKQMQRIINWAVQRCLLVRHRWKRDNHVNNAMLNELVQWEPFETTIARQSLIWLGHVARMNIRRLPKQALFGFWQGHTARPNAPRGQAQWLRYLLAQIQQSELDWYRVAQNRDEWRQAILTEFPLPKIDHRQEILLNRWSPSTNQFPDYAGRFARQKRHRQSGLRKRSPPDHAGYVTPRSVRRIWSAMKPVVEGRDMQRKLEVQEQEIGYLRSRVDRIEKSTQLVVERSEEVEELYKHAEASREFKTLAQDGANGVLRELSRLTGLPWPLPASTPSQWQDMSDETRKQDLRAVQEWWTWSTALLSGTRFVMPNKARSTRVEATGQYERAAGHFVFRIEFGEGSFRVQSGLQTLGKTFAEASRAARAANPEANPPINPINVFVNRTPEELRKKRARDGKNGDGLVLVVVGLHVAEHWQEEETTGASKKVVNARKWDAVLLTDVTFHRDGTHDLWVDGHKWKLVVEGKVAIAMGEAMGQRWEAGGARSFKSRPGQGRVLGLHFPRQGRRKGLMLIVCYAPISSARRTDRQEFLRQVTEVKARTPGGDWLIVGGDFNAEIGANQAQHYPTVMGQFGSGSTSRTGPELLEWCQQAREAKRKWHETLDAAIIREEGDRRQLAWEKLVEICLQTSMEILGLRQFRRDDELRDPQRQQDYAQALRDSRVAQATVAQPEAEREAWKEHFRQLQEGREWAVDHVWANVKPEAAAPYRWMGEPPTDEEIEACGQRMKNAKAAGADGFVAEFYKLGSPALRRQVHGLVRAAWAEACSALDGEEGAGWPEVWNRGIVVPLWKKKGDRSNKNTWRGICLLSVGSNLLARVVAQRTQLWSDGWLSEEQAGFRKGRGVDDVLQVTRRITEEAATTKPSDDVILIRLFDIEKAYPRVSKDSLWKVLSIKGAPDNFIKVCKALHEATRYQVRIHGGESQEYEADKGLREGCPSSPPLFNAYHQAVLEDFSEAEEMARAEVLLETTMRAWHFGHQRGRAQMPHSIRVKIMKAVIMPTLTCFGRSRAWNQNQVKQMQRIINWAVQRCLLVRHRWKRDNHVNNAMLNELVQWEPFETTIARQSLIWLGHVARMNIRRLPKQALFGFWQGRTARPNAPRGQAQWLRYLLAQIQQSELDWYRVAQNRDEWRQAILTEFPLPKIDHRQEILLNRWSPSTNQFPDYAGRFARQKRHRQSGLRKRSPPDHAGYVTPRSVRRIWSAMKPVVEGRAMTSERKKAVQDMQRKLEVQEQEIGYLRSRVDRIEKSTQLVVERSEEVEELYKHAEASREFKTLAQDGANGVLRELSRLTGLPWPLPASTPSQWQDMSDETRKQDLRAVQEWWTWSTALLSGTRFVMPNKARSTRVEATGQYERAAGHFVFRIEFGEGSFRVQSGLQTLGKTFAEASRAARAANPEANPPINPINVFVNRTPEELRKKRARDGKNGDGKGKGSKGKGSAKGKGGRGRQRQ